MYLLTIFLPLFGSIISGFGGRWLGFYGACLITNLCVILSFLLSLIIFFEISLNHHLVFINLFIWFQSGELVSYWGFIFDSVTSLMLIVVTSISSLVHLYSIDYMKNDPHFPRFTSFLSIFTFFMLILISSNNLVQLFLGWEGVGLASYLLINFWFTRLSANKAAIKALLVNRVGDLGLLLAIFFIFFIFKTSDFITIFSLVPFFTDYFFYLFNFKINLITTISIFLLLGAIGKSAQLGLHTWLPDAMEGPTPVSALIHAATMVTAGVFLIIRFSPLIEFSSLTLILLVIFGSLTAFFAAFTGIFQHDLKKIIAYSTCSQLGYMIFCCGLSYYNVSLFHLVNHAFFKALLFLGAGSVIHSISNEQDLRKMGSLITFLPITYSTILIGSLALTGFPFLTGFYSKDVILEISQLFRNSNLPQFIGILACWLGILAAFLTAFYSTRLIFLTFLNNYSNNRKFIYSIHESSSFLTIIPLILLSFGSLFIGYLLKDLFIGQGVDLFKNSIFIWPSHMNLIESEFLLIKLKWFPFFFTILGILLATLLNLLNFKFFTFLPLFNLFFFLINKKWYFDKFYNKIIVYPIMDFGYLVSFKNLDRGFIELLGPYSLQYFVPNLSKYLIILQTGQLTHYIFFIIISFFAILFLLLKLISLSLLLIFFISIFYL